VTLTLPKQRAALANERLLGRMRALGRLTGLEPRIEVTN
jgi:hypothetical protein